MKKPEKTSKTKNWIESFRLRCLCWRGRVTESLQQAFNRECKKQGIEFRNGAFHTLRKKFATEKYKEHRKRGESIQQALDSVSHALGHGSKRNKLMKEYICCEIK